MKSIFTFLFALSTSLLFAQQVDSILENRMYVYEDDFVVDTEKVAAISQAIVFTKGNVRARGEGQFRMSKNSKIFYMGTSDIEHPYIIKVSGKIKLHECVTINRYHGERIMLLDGVRKVYEGYVDDIPKDLKVKKGLYDLLVKNVGYYKNVIIK